MQHLELEIDALYQLPLTDFTAARNALAKRVGGDQRSRVKALVKPTAVPGVVNQLYWKARPVYDRLLKAGADLRRAQLAALSGRRSGALLAKATAAHQKALAEAVQRAARLGTRAGAASGRSASEELTRMLEAVSLAPTHPETRGRLTTRLQPPGFEVLAGVTPALRIVQPAAVSPRQKTTDNSAPAVRVRREPSAVELGRQERERRRLEEQARRTRERAIAAASRALAKALAAETRAKAVVDSAYEALEQVRNDRRAAEQTLRRLKS